MLWSDSLFVRAHAFYEKHGYVRRGGLRSLQDLSNSIEFGYAKPLAGLVVEPLDIAAAESAERALAGILIDSVGDGSSVGFLPPLARDKALGYWREITRGVGQRSLVLLVAWLDGVLVGDGAACAGNAGQPAAPGRYPQAAGGAGGPAAGRWGAR